MKFHGIKITGKFFADEDFIGNLNDIPKDSIVLIDSSTTILGYTILDDVDDQLVYISSSGNGFKTGSTWTQPNHTHPFDIGHVHGLSSGIHNHSMSDGHIHSAIHSHDFGIAADGVPTLIGVGFVVDTSQLIGPSFTYNAIYNTLPFPGTGSAQSQRSTAITGISNTNNTNININTNDNPVSGNTNSGSAQGTTDSNASASSWRPEGRNFTRQQKL